MAIWQYTLYLIPEQKLSEVFSNTPVQINSDVWNETDWWKDYALSANFNQQISLFLPEGNSWNAQTKVWGKTDETEISVHYENNKVDEVTIKLDLRSITSPLVEKICQTAQMCNCLMLTENLKIIRPDKRLLVESIKTSNGFSFVSNPEAYLERETMKL